MHVYLNGKMIQTHQAMIGIGDAGFTHGIGLFETMSVHHGRVFRLRGHIDRLLGSANQLGLTGPNDGESYQEAVQQTIRHNQLERARLKLTVTGGPMSPLTSGPSNRPGQPKTPKPTVLVVASEPTDYDPAYFEQGIMAVIGPAAANPFDAMAGHKTLSYWHRLITLRQAAAVGAGEAIWLNTTNHLASGAVSNIFLVKDKQLWTPFARGEEVPDALPAPVLPGVIRKAVIQLARTREVPVTRRMLTVHDLLEADEVFLTNSSWLVLPVSQVEKKTIGDGKIGPVTRQIRDSLLQLVEQETLGDTTPSTA